ncbi:LptA/OstA family protein [Litorimonas sp. WD9-15]|uniref:LptA/OstA family protein n=1 Tax=Litorimonas sp. WD9-15 TaxID=3418716 RepID=UPI003D08500D
MTRFLGAFALLAFIALPNLAAAQFSSDSSADTVLYSDNTVSKNGVITLTGQADIRQGDVRLLADKVEIYTAGNNGGGMISTDRINRVVATGNFYYITPEQEVRGERGVYTAANDTFVVTGDVVLLQDDSVVTGTRLDYNLETRDAKVKGTCTGRKCAKQDRVAILIRSTDASQAGTN